MLHMPLFQIELLMRISGKSNFSGKTFLKNLSNCFANQENEKNYHYSVSLIILEYSRNLRRKVRKTWIELHIYFQ